MEDDINPINEIRAGLEEYFTEEEQRKKGELLEQKEKSEEFYEYLISKITGLNKGWIDYHYELQEGNFTPEYVLQKTPKLHPLQGIPIEEATKYYLRNESQGGNQ